MRDFDVGRRGAKPDRRRDRHRFAAGANRLYVRNDPGAVADRLHRAAGNAAGRAARERPGEVLNRTGREFTGRGLHPFKARHSATDGVDPRRPWRAAGVVVGHQLDAVAGREPGCGALLVNGNRPIEIAFAAVQLRCHVVGAKGVVGQHEEHRHGVDQRRIRIAGDLAAVNLHDVGFAKRVWHADFQHAAVHQRRGNDRIRRRRQPVRVGHQRGGGESGLGFQPVHQHRPGFDFVGLAVGRQLEIKGVFGVAGPVELPGSEHAIVNRRRAIGRADAGARDGRL